MIEPDKASVKEDNILTGDRMSDKEKLDKELKDQEAAAEAAVEKAGDAAKKEAEAKGATPEEVKAAVETARKEEKDKLYPTIEALKDTVKAIQDQLREEKEEKEKIKKEAEDEAERQRQAKLSADERQLEAIKRIEEQLSEERKARQALEKKQEAEAKKQRLEKYRAEALKAAGDELIEDLVKGNTEAEIDASIEIAKARYAELVAKVKEETGDRIKRGMPKSTNPDTAALEEQELDERLTAVDADKYLKDPAYREKIKATLEGEYQKAAGRV